MKRFVRETQVQDLEVTAKVTDEELIGLVEELAKNNSRYDASMEIINHQYLAGEFDEIECYTATLRIDFGHMVIEIDRIENVNVREYRLSKWDTESIITVLKELSEVDFLYNMTQIWFNKELTLKDMIK